MIQKKKLSMSFEEWLIRGREILAQQPATTYAEALKQSTIADGSFTAMYDFNGIDGKGGYGSLISDGTYLYGMTEEGGESGTVFKIKIADNSFTNMYSFVGANEANPYSSLISDGTYLYGLTRWGGIYFASDIFRIKIADNSYTSLYSFKDIDGSEPLGTLMMDGNYLYGMTAAEALMILVSFSSTNTQ